MEILDFYKLKKRDRNKPFVDLLIKFKGLNTKKGEKKEIQDIRLDNKVFVNASEQESFPLLIIDEKKIYNKHEIIKTLNELKTQEIYSIEFSKNYPMGFKNKDVVGGVLIVKTLNSPK